MSIFNRYTADEIKQHFTHYGLFCGIVPVYVGDIEDGEGCTMAVRNWWPEWLMSAADALYGLACIVGTLINPQLEPKFAILITGEIE